ncbi:tripartite tricarboxylate transporter substrate binding protein [Hoeflea prorocentri]|uniref:Tripartite tricarboxylate transporter substrate-binding protein n=1 Tax=Hoeflea prorocentri TaxID=1922333 RepID=A0A9X3UKL5_9HYPH|nr:tripartite tricarboxylate transporter substrate-binding protein [Hoeflea prorocentri]MCY6382553.1 tripartite tricarboxylate transporter substrate-binding protein [Hoeflea prorocentri]MDA5400353.1 tripartite tricarboxylate transporter substrate-binding protein [Hoeflea prorocentri]
MLKKLTAALAVSVFTLAASAGLAQAQTVDEIKFLIPGGAGGGWDGTARGTGEALTKSGIVGSASYENMSGGGGGKAIAHIIETKDQNTLMVNSTPIVIRSLQKVFPQSFRDLTPIAGIIGDYGAIVVGKNSDINDLGGLLAAYKADPTAIAIGGGSVAGGMDHLIAALVMKNAGESPTDVKYIPYDAGGKAMAGLLSGEIAALTTGFGEALELARQGEVKVLCVTAMKRLPAAPDTPTCDESGSKGTDFVNWRGFFGAPGLSDDKKAQFVAALEAMYATPEWVAVRDRNGWVEIFNPGDDFTSFLEQQEEEVGGLMKELGFL